MKKWIILSILLVVFCVWTIAFCDEKEILQWEARALIAELSLQRERALKVPQVIEAEMAIQNFVKKLDAKGFMATQDGTIVEKPKPVEPNKEEVIPTQPQPKPKK